MQQISKKALAATALACLVALPISAGEATFVETFDGGSNEGGWTWGFGDTILDAGGNPGAQLVTNGLDTFAPRPRTTTGGAFVGDYRAMNVTSVGIDLITNAVDFSAEERPCTLMLIYDNGTPADPFDDTAAYFLGPNVPLEGQGWISYDFSVPSQMTELPAGWLLLNLGDSGAPANHTWDEVIQNVTTVQYHYGDPTFFFIFQQWALGMDNPRITMSDGGGGDERFVTICHVPPGNPANAHTITVGMAALTAHMAHGDSMGECQELDAVGQSGGNATTLDQLVDRGTGGNGTIRTTKHGVGAKDRK
jgi:hypothetical protein